MTPPAIEAVPALGGGGGGAVTTVAGRTGDVVLTAADVGAGQLPSGVLLPSGIVVPSSADISGILGTSSSKAAAGNDARLSDTRTPTDGSVTDAKVNAAAAIALSKLATNPLARANHTGTQTMSTISDAGALATKSAIASADITDGAIVDADINAAAAISASKLAAIPESGVTNLVTDLAAKQASATPNFGSGFLRGLHTYSSIDPASAQGTVLSPNSGDGRFQTITIGETGFIRDLSVLIKVNQAVNMSLIILDTGQANATHTVRTCKAVSSASAMPAAGAWFTYDPDLAVTAGDTLAFGVIIQGTTGGSVGSAGVTGINVAPTTRFYPSSGAGTTNQKYGFTVASANIPTLNNTVTDANCTTANIAIPMFQWVIAAS